MMKIKIFLILLFIQLSTRVSAQEKTPRSSHNTFSFGAELIMPVGIYNNEYPFAAGVSAQFNYLTSRNTALTLLAGYNNFFLRSTYGGGSEGFIPVLVGVERIFSSNIFGSLQAGYTLSAISGGGNAFTYVPGIGYKFKNISALLKYIGKVRSAIPSNAVGVRLAYSFGK